MLTLCVCVRVCVLPRCPGVQVSLDEVPAEGDADPVCVCVLPRWPSLHGVHAVMLTLCVCAAQVSQVSLHRAHADADADPLCECVCFAGMCVCVCCPSVPSLPSWSAC